MSVKQCSKCGKPTYNNSTPIMCRDCIVEDLTKAYLKGMRFLDTGVLVVAAAFLLIIIGSVLCAVSTI